MPDPTRGHGPTAPDPMAKRRDGMDTAPLVPIPGATLTRQVIWLATPVAIEQALLYLVGLSDTLLTGRFLSTEHLAAVTVASYLLWFMASLLTVVSVGATALVARLYGSNQREAASRVTQQAIGLAVLVGVVTMVAGLATADWVVSLMNLRGLAAESAALYLRIILSVVPLLACTTAGVACLRGAGDTRTGMWVMVLVNVVNVGLSWGLVRGLGPLPALGFPGIAVGTAVAEGVGGLAVLAALASGRAGLRLGRYVVRPNRTDLGRILRVSLPAAGEALTNVFGQLWFLGVINQLGPVSTAAHGVAIRCEALAFLTITAFSVAASTLTGQYLGANRSDLARRSVNIAWVMGAGVLSVLGAVIALLAGPMFSAFLGTSHSPVAAEGVPVLRLVAFALPALATISVLSGALRGAGDTRWPWLIVVLGYAGARMPLTYALTASVESGGLGLGLYGAWVAMFIDLHVRGGLIALRFYHGGWIKARV